jgi:hypothetical protein
VAKNFGQFGKMPDQGGERVVQQRGGADAQQVVASAMSRSSATRPT